MGYEHKIYGGLSNGAYQRLKEREARLRVVDSETGEIIEHYEPTPKYSDKQRQARKIQTKMNEYHQQHGGFVLAIIERQQTIMERLPDFTQSDMARLIFIATYVGYAEQGANFGYLKHDNGYFINKKGLGELLEMSRNRFNEFYNKLTEAGIIEEHGDNIAMNPEFFFRGDTKEISGLLSDKRHTRIYRKTIRELYKEYGGRKVRQLGIIYAVLPFIHFKHSILAHNPEEKVAKYVEPMTLGELAELIGYKDAARMRQALRAVMYQGKPVFKFVEHDNDARKKLVMVNPAVIFGGNFEALEILLPYFNK